MSVCFIISWLKQFSTMLRVKLLLLIILFEITALCSGQFDYCSLDANHIACNNNGVIWTFLFYIQQFIIEIWYIVLTKTFGPACPSNAKIINFTKSLQEIVLKAHNNYRNSIANGKLGRYKKAGRMATLVSMALIMSFLHWRWFFSIKI